MQKILVTIWLTALWFLLLGNVHAWEVPSFVRLNGGYRMWFTTLQGDLVQKDRTKIDLTGNLGVKKEALSWELFSSLRLENIHVFRIKWEPTTMYAQSRNDSALQVWNLGFGYDLDFYMSPQALFGANVDLDVTNVRSRVRDVTVGMARFNYDEDATRVIPSLGIHGIFYPVVTGIALRPNLSGRARWMSYEGLECWDWEASSAVDIPVNKLWTWSVNSGYRYSHSKIKRDRDTVDMNRSGFFVETAILF